MKKSKTTSLLKIISIIIFVVAITNTCLTYSTLPESKYKENETIITGTITNCVKTEYNYQITLKGKENILVTYNKDFTCKLGIKIKAEGEISKPSKNTIFNLFNYQNYLLSKKINYTFLANTIKIIDGKSNTLYQVKNYLQTKINTYQSKDYLNTFILGNTKTIEEDAMESYRNNGISHLLAISGMHITLLSAIILFILNKINSRKTINYLLVISFLIFYMFLTNFTPSVVRATLMFIILTIKKALKLKINTIYLLFLVCGLYLLYNPYMIYNIGFLFSFIITFYLIVFSKLIQKQKTYLRKILTISLMAFLGSMPIQIINFHEINLLSPLINLIFVPLVSFILYPLSLLTLIIKPLDYILYVLTTFTENFSIILTNISINIILKHINLIVIIFYYLIITFTLYKLQKGRKKYLVFLIIIIIIHSNINYFEKDASITMIDVGQGDSLLIKLDHNKGNILIDTGGWPSYNKQKTYDLAKNKIIPYLKSEGVKKLDYLILTHGDYDHMGEAINLINNFKINKVIFNNDEFNELETKLIKILKKKKIKYYNNLDVLNIDKYKLQFLNTKIYDNENDNSNVIYFNYNNYKFLFMGDAGKEKEEDLLKKYNLSNIDFLKVGHHGSDTSSSKKFINKINPKYSLISVGKNNNYGHPKKEVLKILSKTKIYRTDIDGSIKIKLNTKAYTIKTCNEKSS